jgi:nicotinamidase-related amidase
MSTALLLIDVLDGIFDLPVPLHGPDQFLDVIADLLGRARRAGALVVHVQHKGPPGSRFGEGAPTRHIHAVASPRDQELVVSKEHPDAFQGSTLDEKLRASNISRLVVAGFATETCVDTMVRSAYARGFAVDLVSDGHTTTANAVLDARTIILHHNAILARFARVAAHTDVSF